MKHLILYLVCLLLFSCTGKKKANDLARFNYKGQVKLVTSFTYYTIAKSGEIVKDSLNVKLVTKYNNEGFITEQSSYKHDKLTYHRIQKYNSHNNIIEEISTGPALVCPKPGSVISSGDLETRHYTYAYKYDAKGNWLEEKATSNDKPWYRLERILDNKGNTVEEKTYQPGDTLNKIETFKYSQDGALIEKNWLHPDSTLIYKYTYKHDDKGNITKIGTYDSSDTLQWKEQMTYDERGNKIKDISTHKNSLDNWDWRYELTNFDAAGNWLKETFTDKGKPSWGSMEERTIEYY